MEKELYQQFYQIEDRHWWFVGTKAIITTQIKQLELRPNAVILDAGCGTGGRLKLLESFGTVHGIDISQLAVTLCQGKGFTTVQRGTIEHLPYTDKYFDLVVAADVLEHINNDRNAFREMLRVTKPGGHILLTVPAFMWLWSSHDINNHHCRRYTKGSLLKLIQVSSITITRVSYFNFFLFPFAILRTILWNPSSKARPQLVLPPRCINFLLTLSLRLEGILLKMLSFPFGVSLICVVQKIK